MFSRRVIKGVKNALGLQQITLTGVPQDSHFASVLVASDYRMKRFAMPTSVENLAHMLFTEITELGFTLNRIEVRETDTSVIVYTREDWISDNRVMAAEQMSAKKQ